MTREEQVKEYRKKHFQITLNYEQHLLLRWLIAEAFHDVREDKFNLEDLAEQIFQCRIMGPGKWTYSDEEVKPKSLPLDPNHTPLSLDIEPKKEEYPRIKINKGAVTVAIFLIISLSSGLTFLTMKTLQKKEEVKSIPTHVIKSIERKYNERNHNQIRPRNIQETTAN